MTASATSGDPVAAAVPAGARRQWALAAAVLPSPQADHGYDVGDYVGVDRRIRHAAPEFDELVAEAHERRLQGARSTSSPTTPRTRPVVPERDLDPDHRTGALHVPRPGGTAGRRTAGPRRSAAPPGRCDEARSEYYLHFFTPEQPDLDWHQEDGAGNSDRCLRFWSTKASTASGSTSAQALFKARDLPEMVEARYRGRSSATGCRRWTQPELHPLYRSWRGIADEYPGDRMFVGEIALANQETIARYLTPDQLHPPSTSRSCTSNGNVRSAMRETIDRVHATLDAVGARHDLGLREP